MAPYSDLNLFVESSTQPTYLNALGDTEPGGRFKRTTLISTNSPSAGLTTMTVSTYICICSQYGWRSKFHPVNSSSFKCRFTEEKEELNYIFTQYNK
jgi:hypothetical protein